MAGKYEKMLDLEDRINKTVGNIWRRTAFLIDQNIVPRTPVLDGYARMNWQVSFNEPITSELDETDRSGNLAIQRALQTIEAGKTINYGTIHIRNNLPYIEKLNNGSSEQAPKNFVQMGISGGLSAAGF